MDVLMKWIGSHFLASLMGMYSFRSLSIQLSSCLFLTNFCLDNGLTLNFRESEAGDGMQRRGGFE
jgi:hypothetical protein